MSKKRPETVPNGAMWNKSDNEWELKIRGKNGVIVEKKWWLAPNGHLCCHTYFDKMGQMISAKRYHPNGEVSLDLSFNENGDEVSIYYHSTEKTEEYFPRGSFKNEWTAHRVVGVFPKTYVYYDVSGNLLSHNDSSLLDLKEGAIGETAEQALNRYEKFIKKLKKNTNVNIDDLSIYMPKTIRKVTEGELQEQEKAFGITLPPSYRKFVLKKGLIEFDGAHKMFLDFSKLGDTFSYWDVDAKKEFSKSENERLDKLITFSDGDESLQITWFHCFDYSTLNKDTGEVEILDFDQDELWYVGKTEFEMCMTNGFDDYIKNIVDSYIEDILEEI